MDLILDNENRLIKAFINGQIIYNCSYNDDGKINYKWQHENYNGNGFHAYYIHLDIYSLKYCYYFDLMYYHEKTILNNSNNLDESSIYFDEKNTWFKRVNFEYYDNNNLKCKTHHNIINNQIIPSFREVWNNKSNLNWFDVPDNVEWLN